MECVTLYICCVRTCIYGSQISKPAKECSGVEKENSEGFTELSKSQVQHALHACAHFDTLQTRLYVVFKGFTKVSKPADMCSTLGNVGDELH